jgi:hypothetical protein
LPDSILNDNQKEAFYKLLDEKITKNHRSVLELLDSKDQNDESEAIWYAKQILQSILESSNIYFDPKTNRIEDIKSPTTKAISKYS